MYVCLCNGITERDVRRLAAERDCRVRDVYSHFGERGCGRCAEHIHGVLKETRRSAPLNSAMIGLLPAE